MERRTYVIKNVTTMLITYITTIGISFIVRAVFVHKLGNQYLGLNGVLTSILSVLSISDLGMESVFSFLLYKPLANNDTHAIRNFVALFKRVYSLVGLFVFVAGISLLPFLPTILGKQGQGLENVTLIYFILLINAAASYLFTYNRTVLNANQRNYIITSITFYTNTIINLLQIAFLYWVDSMVIYVSLFLISTVTTNIILSRKVLREYPFLNKLPKHARLDAKTKKILIHNTIGGLSNKLGSIVVFASDNILLSIFVNLTTVGLYSNYTMIINSVLGLVQKIFGTITATVGNIAIKSPKQGVIVFKQLNFYVTAIAFFVAPQLLTLLRPLINMWLGKEYILSQYIVLLIVINFVLQISRTPSLIYVDAYGLQWIQKWKSVIESVLNIVFSLICLGIFHLGLIGILLGTLGSTVLFVLWYEPYLVLKYGLKLDEKEQLISLAKILLEKVWLILPTVTTWLCMHIIKGSGALLISKIMVMNFIVLFILFAVIFWNRGELKYIYKLALKK